MRSISRDGLTMALSRRAGSDPPGYDLYLATRETTDEQWGEPTPVSELNGEANDVSPFISTDKLQLFFSSDRPGAEQADLFSAERSSLSEPFAEPALMMGVNSPAVESDPWLSRSLDYLIFASSRGDGSTFDLWEARR